jgi:MtN3 and saliva related transmembrane protein
MSRVPSGSADVTGNEDMSIVATVVGLAAGVCTTAANVPQVKKAWTTGQTDDISLWMLLLFACGVGLWVVYGVLQKDIIIILANGISFTLLGALLYLKLLQPRP